MTVFVTGGAGFVGSAIIDALLARNHRVHALVNQRPISDARVQSFSGDLSDPAAIDRAMENCDAVIHLVGIIAEKPSQGVTFRKIHVEGTLNVVDATRRAGIRRYLHMSALGARADAPSLYHRTKFEAEKDVRASGLDWTIFQPSLIHGPGGDFSKMEEAWARGKIAPWLFMPYFGKGLLGMGHKYNVQPIFVDDVARAFVEALDNPKTSNGVFLMGGADQMTWPAMHHLASRIINGRDKPVVPIPAWWAKALSRVVPRVLLPFTHDQVVMSQQDNVCDLSKFVDAFGWMPRGFGSII